jgi:hypothetical protein
MRNEPGGAAAVPRLLGASHLTAEAHLCHAVAAGKRSGGHSPARIVPMRQCYYGLVKFVGHEVARRTGE